MNAVNEGFDTIMGLGVRRVFLCGLSNTVSAGIDSVYMAPRLVFVQRFTSFIKTAQVCTYWFCNSTDKSDCICRRCVCAVYTRESGGACFSAKAL